jgi:predicted Zn-dependent peptidase
MNVRFLRSSLPGEVMTRLASFGALLLIPAAAAGQTAQYPRVDFVRDSLPNGLQVIYHEDHSTPVVGVNIWYDVGSKNEVQGRTGFAHLFEHVMFKGSKNVPDGQHFSMLEAAGGRAGADINGTTYYDRTNYFEQVPSNQLELALWLEADRMGTLTEVLTREKLENQKDVVMNEKRQSYDNQPYGASSQEMLALAYPPGHPYHHDVIGSMEDLAAANVEDVNAFFRTYYAPGNAVLVIAGDIDVTQAKELVRKHFGWIPRGPLKPALRDARLPPTLGATHRKVIEDDQAPAPAVYVGFRVPNARSSQVAAAEMLYSMIGSGRSSHLYRTLVLEKQVATGVNAFKFDMVEGEDLMVFNARGRPGGDPAALEAAMMEALGSLDPVLTQAVLDRVRAQQRFSFINQLQTLGGFFGRADRLAEGLTYHDDPNWVNTILPAYDAVTVDQVKALAADRLIPLNRITLVFVPKPAANGEEAR